MPIKYAIFVGLVGLAATHIFWVAESPYWGALDVGLVAVNIWVASKLLKYGRGWH